MTAHAGPVVVSRPLPYLEAVVWPLPHHPLTVLAEDASAGTLRARVSDAAGLVVAGDPVDAQLISAAPNLKVVAQYGIGVDNIDLAAASAAGVTVVNLPDLVTDATAELTVGLMLACARRIVEADRSVRERGAFPGGSDPLLSVGLHGRSLGIVGPGRVGRRVGEIAATLGMRLHYWGRSACPYLEQRFEAVRHPHMTSLCRSVDVLTVHVPRTSATEGLVAADQLGALPNHAVVVNTARGGIVNETDLAVALERGEVAAAGLDVFDGEPQIAEALLSEPRTVLTPHVGTSTVETRRRMSRTILEEVATVLAGREPRNRVSSAH